MFVLWHVLTFTVLNSVYADHECGIENAYCHQHNALSRSVDGSCNNLDHPNWGTQFSVYDRLVPAKYGRKDSLALDKNGKPLPNARKISTTVFTEETQTNPELTRSAIDYGQLIGHDLGELSQSRGPLECCTPMLKELTHPPDDCANVRIPHSDPFYSSVNATCISVLRTRTNRELGCSLHLPYTAQISKVTAFLDLSIVYGNTEEVCRSLRSHTGGALMLNIRNNYQWLPDTKDRSILCPFIPDTERCYSAGDDRVNQNPPLALLQTIWAREHNRIAKRLFELNPHWNDEKLFNVARSIAIAEHQFLTYYALLPLWTSRSQLLNLRIIFESDNYINDYDENMRPHIYNEFSQAAFRHFHSLVPGTLQLINPTGSPYKSVVLRDHINFPRLLEYNDYFDSLLRGFTAQPPLSSDAFTDPELTNFFVSLPLKYGVDLKAIDMQRAREHGLGSYNDLREFCDLGRVHHFYQLLEVMDTTSVEKLEYLYDHVDDIDLVVGGSLEIPIFGTLYGPTFSCIIYEQFYKTRKADRFFFENAKAGFTHLQLEEIRKFSFSRLICDNGNNVTHMQIDGFLQISNSNPRVPCNQLPKVNLNLWKENHY